MYGFKPIISEIDKVNFLNYERGKHGKRILLQKFHGNIEIVKPVFRCALCNMHRLLRIAYKILSLNMSAKVEGGFFSKHPLPPLMQLPIFILPAPTYKVFCTIFCSSQIHTFQNMESIGLHVEKQRKTCSALSAKQVVERVVSQ